MFLLAVVLLLACVLAVLVLPVWRRDAEPIPMGDEAERDQEHADLGIEREGLARSLRELEVEHGQGRLTGEDFARLKAGDERHLLGVLDRLEALEAAAPKSAAHHLAGRTPSWGAMLAPAAMVLVLSSGVYAYLQWKQTQVFAAMQARAGGPGMPDPRQMVSRLETRLRENPNDLEGQIMLGRSYLALDRIPEARKAWSTVLELNPRNHEAHYNLGVILINTRKFDDPDQFKTALVHFDAALVNVPMEPAVNWYR
ncbi:MAG: c-type cytochrome biogenesis protein CcmI, partial [Nitrospiria bacterium]